MPLYFKFSGSRVPAINRDWLRSLAASASGSQGLIVTSEESYEKPPMLSDGSSMGGPQIDPNDLIGRQSDVVTVADPSKHTAVPTA